MTVPRGVTVRGRFTLIGMPVYVEYLCEVCSSRVLLLGINRRPAHGFCIICAFLSEHVPDPVELVELRGRIACDLAD